MFVLNNQGQQPISITMQQILDWFQWIGHPREAIQIDPSKGYQYRDQLQVNNSFLNINMIRSTVFIYLALYKITSVEVMWELLKFVV